jgi:hypothetical protein
MGNLKYTEIYTLFPAIDFILSGYNKRRHPKMHLNNVIYSRTILHLAFELNFRFAYALQ